jgi:predicted peptidase
LKHIIVESVFLLIAVIMFSGMVPAQIQFYEKQLFVQHDDTLRYLQLRNQHGDEKMPLVLYLHSGDANGRDNEKQLTHSPAIVVDSTFRANHSFCFIAPQCKPKKSWALVRAWKDGDAWKNFTMDDSMAFPLKLVKALVDSLSQTAGIDATRMYVLGASMGGFGTWDLICRFPSLFAAAVPVCGVADTLKAKELAHVPIWVFHGAKDAHVDVQYSRVMVDAIKNVGGQPKYTEYPDLPHDIRDTVYNNRQIWDWMFAQQLKR